MGVFALVVAMVCAAQAEEVEQLVDRAVAAHPSVAALRHREAALREEAAVDGAWPDPRVSVEYSNAPVDSFTLTDHPMSGIQLRVDQTIRPPRWSRTRRDAGSLQAEAAAHTVEEQQLALARQVRRTWWALTRSRLLRAITESHLERTKELLGAIRARYETGSVGQSALLRLELLRDRLGDDLGDFVAADAALTSALSEALAAPVPEIETPATVSALPPPPPSDWRTLATAHRPALGRLDDERRSAEEDARVARLDALPDPTVWVGYRVRAVATPVDAGTDFVSIGASVPVPSGSGRRAGGARGAALARARASRASYEATLNEIEANMTAIGARWRRAHDKTRAYDDALLPAARATLATTRSDFAVGRADVASLFEAEVALLDLERARITAAVETHLVQADAIAMLGVAPRGEAP